MFIHKPLAEFLVLDVLISYTAFNGTFKVRENFRCVDTSVVWLPGLKVLVFVNNRCKVSILA